MSVVQPLLRGRLQHVGMSASALSVTIWASHSPSGRGGVLGWAGGPALRGVGQRYMPQAVTSDNQDQPSRAHVFRPSPSTLGHSQARLTEVRSSRAATAPAHSFRVAWTRAPVRTARARVHCSHIAYLSACAECLCGAGRISEECRPSTCMKRALCRSLARHMSPSLKFIDV